MAQENLYFKEHPEAVHNKLFAEAFNKEKHISRVELIPYIPIYLSFDFNIDPMSCILAQKYDGKFYILEEFVYTPKDSKEEVLEILNEFILSIMDKLPKQAQIFLTGDSSYDWFGNVYLKPIKNIFLNNSNGREYKIEILINDKNETTVSIFNIVNNSFYNDRTYVHPLCNSLIKALTNTTVRDKFVINRGKDNHEVHLLDCLKYLLSTDKNHDNEKYRTTSNTIGFTENEVRIIEKLKLRINESESFMQEFMDYLNSRGKNFLIEYRDFDSQILKWNNDMMERMEDQRMEASKKHRHLY